MSFSVYILFEMRYKGMNNFKNMLIICIIFTKYDIYALNLGIGVQHMV